MQSRLLVSVAVPIFAVLVWTVMRGTPASADSVAVAVAISVCFGFVSWRLRAATPAAAGFGGTICLLVMLSARVPGSSSPLRTGLTPLLLLFVLTFAATRLGRERKQRAGLAESRKGRSAAQVLANLAAGAVASSVGLNGFFAHTQWASSGGALHAGVISMLAAFVEATADTVSSEVGQAFGGIPRSVVTLRRVPPGTDGAITWTGTLAGVGGAAIVALSGMAAFGLTAREAGIAFLAGVMGLFLDSLLGATVELRGWIGNDLVNFASTSGAAWLAWVLVRGR